MPKGENEKERESPLGIVRAAAGREVRVIVKGGVEYHGILRAFDDYINMVMENAIIREPGREPTSERLVFIRGSNVLHITLPEPK
ncbi:MAG: LSM domain-containing protein [Conexivisphaera sp.]